MRWFLMLLTLVAGTASAADWTVPQRGTAERKAMMDALRPHAEWLFGAPVKFVAHDLRRAGNVGYGALKAQRPGGKAINIFDTPGYQRGEVYVDPGDPVEFHVLYKKSGDTWVAVHWSSGATDVWFSWEPLCREYRPVIAEFCRGL